LFDVGGDKAETSSEGGLKQMSRGQVDRIKSAHLQSADKFLGFVEDLLVNLNKFPALTIRVEPSTDTREVL
jgi:hypothetical protein